MKEDTDFKYIIRLDSELSQIQDFDILLERILFEARKVVHADAGSIYITEKTDDGVEKLFIKYSQNDTIQKTLPPGKKMLYSFFSVDINEKSISGYCALKRKLINIPDMYNISPEAPYSFYSNFDMITGYKTISTLTIPLIAADQCLLGVVQVINAKDKKGNVIPFKEDDEVLLSHFATNACTALQRVHLMRSMILRLIKVSELRDPKETGTHVSRVAGYAAEIYEQWALRHNISEEEKNKYMDNLKISSMLHDIGKVAISDTILKKPARFTPEEYRVMQSHTVSGANLFHDINSTVDQLSKEIALTHHENWDGTGYPGWINPDTGIIERPDENGNPLGREGEEIPLGGRIVALADVYDALCSKRVYKDPWCEDDILNEMRKLSGTKFDPELVDIFFEILPNIKQTQQRYPEGPEIA